MSPCEASRACKSGNSSRAGEAEADPAGEEGQEGQYRDHVARRPGGKKVGQRLGVPFLHLLRRQDPLLMR
jgi:hypothetical protein